MLELFRKLGSKPLAVTLAILFIMVPDGTDAPTVATTVAVAEAPLARDAKVIVRLLPVPPDTPALVALLETNVVAAGRASDTTTLPAALGPLFVTTNV